MENNVFATEAPKASTKKPSKLKVIIAAILTVVVLAGGVSYMVFLKGGKESPPTLKSAEDSDSTLQGFMKQKIKDPKDNKKYTLVGFEQADKDAFTANLTKWNTEAADKALKSNAALKDTPAELAKKTEEELATMRIVHTVTPENGGFKLLYSDTATDFKAISQEIDPKAGAYTIAAYMASTKFSVLGDAENPTKNKYVGDKMIAIEKASEAKVASGQVFIVPVVGSTDFYGLKDKSKWAEKSFPFCEQKEAGWYLGALASNDLEKELGADCMKRISSIWQEVDWYAVKDENGKEVEPKKYSNFEEIDLAVNKKTKSSIIWVNFDSSPKEVAVKCDAKDSNCKEGQCVEGYVLNAKSLLCEKVTTVELNLSANNPDAKIIEKGSKNILFTVATIKADKNVKIKSINIGRIGTGSSNDFVDQKVELSIDGEVLGSEKLVAVPAPGSGDVAQFTVNKEIKKDSLIEISIKANIAEKASEGVNKLGITVVCFGEESIDFKGLTLPIYGNEMTINGEDGPLVIIDFKDSPNEKVIEQGTTGVKFSEFTFTATKDATIDTITIGRGGAGNPTDFVDTNVELFIDDTSIGKSPLIESINDQKPDLVKFDINKKIPKGQSVKIAIKAAITDAAAIGNINQLGIKEITFKEKNVIVNTSLPIWGNLMTIVAKGAGSPHD